MDRDIKVVVKDKVATAPTDAVIVCGNSDYTIIFQFDDEWDGLEAKTARFKYSAYAGPKQHIDVPFTGNVVEVPILTDVHKVEVGVYAGNLTTTTGAPIRCLPCIRCGAGEKVEPNPDKYDELMELLTKILKGGGAGLTEEQAAALAANTEARHTHNNQWDVLDLLQLDRDRSHLFFTGYGTIAYTSDVPDPIPANDINNYFVAGNPVRAGFIGRSAVMELIDQVNARFATKEALEGLGGAGSGALPSVTEADNGKLLMVQNGAWAAVALPAAEGAVF